MSALQRLPPEILRLIIDNIDGSLIPISTFSKWALDCLAYARYRHINLRRGSGDKSFGTVEVFWIAINSRERGAVILDSIRSMVIGSSVRYQARKNPTRVKSHLTLLVSILKRTPGLTRLTLYAKQPAFGQQMRQSLHSASVVLPLVTSLILVGIGAEIIEHSFVPALRTLNADPNILPKFEFSSLPNHLSKFNEYSGPLSAQFLNACPDLTRIRFNYWNGLDDKFEILAEAAKNGRVFDSLERTGDFNGGDGHHYWDIELSMWMAPYVASSPDPDPEKLRNISHLLRSDCRSCSYIRDALDVSVMAKAME